MKSVFFFFVFLFFTVLAFGQNTIFKGKVIDFETKEPLAFVNIATNNNACYGRTDIDGKFLIKCNSIIEFLKLSYIGYESTEIKLIDDSKFIIIELKQKEVQLKEVQIFPGENPAHRIINQVIKNKDLNNPEKTKAFSYTAYNKMVFTSEQEAGYKKDQLKTDSVSIKTREFFKKQYLMLMESVSKRKFLYPDRNNEIVIGSRISGLKDPLFAMLATQFQSFSFYNDYISLSEKRYLNPISNGSTNKYLFIIQDTVFSGKDTVFIISFQPRKNTNFEGLKGLLYINTNQYAIQNVIAEPAAEEKGTISIRIQQMYEFVNNKQWFPVQLNTDILMKLVTLNNFVVVGKGKMYLSDISINPEFVKEQFNNIVLEIQEGANTKTEEFWNTYRRDSLNEKDIVTYHVIDSLGEASHLDRKMSGLQSLLLGRIPIRFIDLDINKLISYNEYEGFRLGLGLYTNSKISKHFGFGGYFAYGFKDQVWKYGGEVGLMLNLKTETELKYSYSNDVFESGGRTFFDWESTLLGAESYRNYLVKQMDDIEKHHVQISTRLIKNFKTYLWADNYRVKINNDYKYGITEGNASIFLKDFNLAEMGAGFRFAYKEKFLKMRNYNISIGTDYPIVWLQYIHGFNNLMNGECEYDRIDFKVQKSFYIKNVGKTSFQISTGYISGDLPYPLLFNGRGNFAQFTLNSPNSFATMKMNEFLSDRFASIFFTHNFGKLLIRTKKFEPEIVIASNAGLGFLDNKNKHFNADFKTMEKGFFESGLIINNILRTDLYGIGIGGFYRYGTYSFPKFKDNYVINLTITFSL
ncbi:MAG: carboxypeptidase-like regulatory domain-containing protein [Bacteroidetes bacterium]|nr:carboxypeptidase-like regulatory domain-containing protein [Bacteroidota bacterium]